MATAFHLERRGVGSNVSWARDMQELTANGVFVASITLS